MREQDIKAYYRNVYPAIWKTQLPRHGFSKYGEIFLDLLDVHHGMRVLEVGCGTCDPYLVRVAEYAEAHGIDIARELLLTGRNCNDKLHLVQGDIERLPYAESFDRVYCVSTSWYLPNLKSAIHEMWRVLKQQGILVIDFRNKQHITTLADQLATWIKREVLGDKDTGWWRPITPREVFTIFGSLPNCRFEMRGFNILLPVSFPLLGERANLARYFPRLAYGLQLSPLKVLGSKLVVKAYKC